MEIAPLRSVAEMPITVVSEKKAARLQKRLDAHEELRNDPTYNNLSKTALMILEAGRRYYHTLDRNDRAARGNTVDRVQLRFDTVYKRYAQEGLSHKQIRIWYKKIGDGGLPEPWATTWSSLHDYQQAYMLLCNRFVCVDLKFLNLEAKRAREFLDGLYVD
jgi:hypothetical protein